MEKKQKRKQKFYLSVSEIEAFYFVGYDESVSIIINEAVKKGWGGNKSVKFLNLTLRSANALRGAGIDTIDER